MKYKYGKETHRTLNANTKKLKNTKGAKNAVSGSRKKISEKSKKKEVEKKCLELWAKIVKKRFPTCVKCGKSSYLNAHHIFSRRYKSLFLNPDNGISFCRGCHLYFAHCFYEEARDIYINLLGEEKYNELKELCQSNQKVTLPWLEEKYKELKEEWGRG